MKSANFLLFVFLLSRLSPAKTPNPRGTKITDQLSVAQSVKDDQLQVVILFAFINEKLAYGFTKNLYDADFFVLELKDGQYTVTDGVSAPQEEAKPTAEQKWKLFETALVDDSLVAWVTRDLKRFPVDGMKADKNMMSYSYLLPKQEESEETFDETGELEVSFTQGLELESAPVEQQARK